jgi:polysaccharide export outer membrane protein
MKKHRKDKTAFLSVLLIVCGVGLCGGPAFTQVDESADYIIGPKDLLEIKVFGLQDLDTTVRVSEDGLITVPLIGEVKVGGLTKSGIERELTRLFADKYLQNPQVTVFIREYRSRNVSVLGAVKEPGDYELLGRRTILQMISQAGGMTQSAGDEIIVLRKLEDGSNTAINIPVDDLVAGSDIELNIALQPGDIINIPIEKMVKIYVFGQVVRGGALEVKKSNIPTLLQAIAQAGGFSPRAAKGRVTIKRTDAEGREFQIKVNAKAIIKGKRKDIRLKEDDVVYVPEIII